MMSVAHLVAKKLKKSLRGTVKKEAVGSYGIALSGGVDSCSILAEMLGQGLRPVVVSYTPSTHESTDFKMARNTAAQHDLEFIRAIVDMSAEALEANARELVGHGYRSKLEVECLAPLLTILGTAAKAGVATLFTGDQSDGFFINNNWMSRNFDRARGIPGYLRKHVSEDEDAWRIDQLRDIYWNEDRSCSASVQKLGAAAGVSVVVPYRDEKIREAFRGTHWNEVNLPRYKEPIRLAYSEWFETGKILVLDKPVNLHRGDSYFAETMGRTLMDAPHLAGPWKTPAGLYGAMFRGDV